MLSKSVLLLHDNARPHTSRTIWELIESFGWEVLDHAPYSPDLARSDFHLFRYLIHSLSRKRFRDDEEVNAAVNSWLSNQATAFFEDSFQNLILRIPRLEGGKYSGTRTDLHVQIGTLTGQIYRDVILE
ncbi:histone-lysine N-methyltransferase SETMAR [Trichonephila clavipes]|nr:histone-lysine N-methyltransferase SETMAR [Trichonephila clavipes]